MLGFVVLYCWHMYNLTDPCCAGCVTAQGDVKQYKDLPVRAHTFLILTTLSVEMPGLLYCSSQCTNYLVLWRNPCI